MKATRPAVTALVDSDEPPLALLPPLLAAGAWNFAVSAATLPGGATCCVADDGGGGGGGAVASDLLFDGGDAGNSLAVVGGVGGAPFPTGGAGVATAP